MADADPKGRASSASDLPITDANIRLCLIAQDYQVNVNPVKNQGVGYKAFIRVLFEKC